MTSREEEMLTAIANGERIDSECICRRETFLRAIANGEGTANLPTPICREEELYTEIAANGTGGGGGDVVTEDITITPTTSEIVKTRSAGKYINKVTVEAIQTEDINLTPTQWEETVFPSRGKFINKVKMSAVDSSIDQNIQAENIKEGVSILGVTGTYEGEGGITPTGTIEISTNGTHDVTNYASANVNVSGGGEDMLQARVDATNSCDYLFYNYTGDNVDFISGLDTSNVTSMKSMFYKTKISGEITINTDSATTLEGMFQYSDYITKITFSDTSNVTNMKNLFYGMGKIKTIIGLNTSNVTNMYGTFYANTLEELPYVDTSNVTNMGYMCNQSSSLISIPFVLDTSNVTTLNCVFDRCTKLPAVSLTNTSKATNINGLFADCYALETIEGRIDLISVSSDYNQNAIFDLCRKLTSVNVYNIKRPLKLGSGTSWGHLLTLDSLLNAIKELWDNSTATSTKTLTVGSANLEKLANVYVKLVTITDDMRAEDEYIDNKLPFEVCESTDEGAMLIEDYAFSKGWVIQ